MRFYSIICMYMAMRRNEEANDKILEHEKLILKYTTLVKESFFHPFVYYTINNKIKNQNVK